MLGATLLGFVGGLTYTLIVLNPEFRFPVRPFNVQDLIKAAGVNAFLGGVAGFIAWSLSAGEVQAPRSYALYLLSGVGGGSLIQTWVLTIANRQSQATLDRALEVLERIGSSQGGTAGNRLGELSKSLRSSTGSHARAEITREMVDLASKLSGHSRE